MKYNSVKELKEDIETKVQKEIDFEEKLMQSFPNLHRKDANGNVLAPDCGTSCPPGWQPLVYNLCAAIDSYIKCGEISTQKNVVWFKIKMFLYKKIIVSIHNFVHSRINPYELYRPESEKNKKSWLISPEATEKVKANHGTRLKVSNTISSFFRYFEPHYKWNRQPIPAVYIGQIKEKFGTLRFYYDGGDDTIRGMIRFAEHLSSVTCAETGLAGSTHKRGGWYRTLSPKIAKKFKYVAILEV